VWSVVSIVCVQIFESERTNHPFLNIPAFKSVECFSFKGVQCTLSRRHQL